MTATEALTKKDIKALKDRWQQLSMVCFAGCREGRLCSACREQDAITARLKEANSTVA